MQGLSKQLFFSLSAFRFSTGTTLGHIRVAQPCKEKESLASSEGQSGRQLDCRNARIRFVLCLIDLTPHQGGGSSGRAKLKK
ncbi:hypothetical protein M441DRAFT_411800 [Trichoderma asperellum CBS 433.97]|uniref:Uncharacterized protein n=1 Tax=Trichoderma asperellum (strain ATCC 204424 / CBS 433.97 / NBRC 101777) TaxID=1042311 RepID=A0A2T3Z7L7_TRIA4|nr:hypothetical protein M441DRAFT_411800 [Trichoderma asperellum CBS 433.97]PTB40770.1 hypothetical protein M441DRAFT_411800 [Trichoderma asperellum CBS 433.97]